MGPMQDDDRVPDDLVFDSGVTARHPLQADPAAVVAPTQTGDGFNTLRILVAPVACWRADDMCFDFDSSFPGAQIAEGLGHLARLLLVHAPPSKARKRQPPEPLGCPISIFAHADAVGDDSYNKQLSGRRAATIYGLLTRDADLWEELYERPLGNDRWGRSALMRMIEATSTTDGESSDASRFEHDPGARKALYLRYMDALCGSDLKLEKEDFLAQGKDPGGKGDYQGCGEFNPAMILSQQEEAVFQHDQDKTRRNQVNAPNRRVMVLIFRKGSAVDADRWPCPRASEGPAACRKRFWADWEKRRNTRLPDQRRHYEQSEDTYACRFYDRISSRSPCERIGLLSRLQWACFVPRDYERPELLTRSLSGEERQLPPSRKAFETDLGNYRVFDLAALGEHEHFSLQGVESGGAIAPSFLVNQFKLMASLGSPDLLAQDLRLLLTASKAPAPPPAPGPSGPDMLDMDVTFENPLVPENPPDDVTDDDF